jgi:outer membrane protein assembly factor BamB
VTAEKKIVWQYPSPSLPPPPFRFYFPDDAFWVHGGHAILVSMEENHTIAEIAYPSGVMVWSYGHPGVAGSGKGYLYQPDDAYPYKGGVVVADAKNCRILFIDADGHASSQIGTNGRCLRGLPTSLGYPNGDTPLKNGDILISELRGGGFVDRVKPNGTPVWQVKVPNVSLPSDPQPFPDGTFLTVDYNTPGSIVRFTWGGAVVWRYGPTSGHGELSNPSLAAPLPNGLVVVNDDFVHRVLIIDPATNRIVWEYGVRGKPGKAPGYLNTPDGLDLILPNGVIPLHLDFPTDEVTVGRP